MGMSVSQPEDGSPKPVVSLNPQKKLYAFGNIFHTCPTGEDWNTLVMFYGATKGSREHAICFLSTQDLENMKQKFDDTGECDVDNPRKKCLSSRESFKLEPMKKYPYVGNVGVFNKTRR